MHTTLWAPEPPLQVADKPRKIINLCSSPPACDGVSAKACRDEQHYRTLFEAAMDCILVIDPAGRLIDLNHQSCLMLGYSREELLGEPFSKVLDAQLLSRLFPDPAGAPAEGRSVRGEHDLRAKDGTARSLEYVASPLPDGCMLAVVRDVTERKRAARALRTLNDELEQRVAEQTAELRQVNRDLESFSFSVSHDLQAPLRSIGAVMDILLKEHGSQFESDVILYLEAIGQSVHRMGRLIEDLLRLSLTARGDLSRVKNVDMHALAVEAIEDHLEGRLVRTTFDISNLPAAPGDRGLLRQVWTNLIGNAMKYSSKVAQPRIAIGGRANGNSVEYWISDNGAGFDMALAGKLFAPFVRLHPSSEFAGSGIGLATVERIIRRHGGTLRAEGRKGEGATFYFTLPAKMQSARELAGLNAHAGGRNLACLPEAAALPDTGAMGEQTSSGREP